ncbi:hypothetical protein, partial [Pedobacter changchengzhani]|uniref:hypothetical protein n=1 Tax=Pedobacter changchengzhani TaxID=2529274 RepID=UPI001A9F6624
MASAKGYDIEHEIGFSQKLNAFGSYRGLPELFKPVFYGFYKKKGNYFLRSIILDMPSEFLLCNHLCKIWGSSFY